MALQKSTCINYLNTQKLDIHMSLLHNYHFVGHQLGVGIVNLINVDRTHAWKR